MSDPQLVIAELEARVAELERLLQRRSEELCRLQRLLPQRALLMLSRVVTGRPPLGGLAYDPESWEESTTLQRRRVSSVLDDLWLSRPAPVATYGSRLQPAAGPSVLAGPALGPSGTAQPEAEGRSLQGPGLAYEDPEQWHESTSLRSIDVGSAVRDAWRSRRSSS